MLVRGGIIYYSISLYYYLKIYFIIMENPEIFKKRVSDFAQGVMNGKTTVQATICSNRATPMLFENVDDYLIVYYYDFLEACCFKLQDVNLHLGIKQMKNLANFIKNGDFCSEFCCEAFALFMFACDKKGDKKLMNFWKEEIINSNALINDVTLSMFCGYYPELALKKLNCLKPYEDYSCCLDAFVPGGNMLGNEIAFELMRRGGVKDIRVVRTWMSCDDFIKDLTKEEQQLIFAESIANCCLQDGGVDVKELKACIPLFKKLNLEQRAMIYGAVLRKVEGEQDDVLMFFEEIINDVHCFLKETSSQYVAFHVISCFGGLTLEEFSSLYGICEEVVRIFEKPCDDTDWLCMVLNFVNSCLRYLPENDERRALIGRAYKACVSN